MNALLRKSAAVAALLSVLVTARGLAEAPVIVSFGVYTSDKPTVMYRMFKPVLSALEKRMEEELEERVKIKLQIYSTYDAAIEALVRGEVDFVRFGPSSYITAKQRNPGVQLLAIEEDEGNRRFNGIIFCRDNSQIQSLRDLEGKSFAFGDDNSTIGRYLSQALLVENGVRARDLSRYEYLGRHDLVVTAVLHGRFDAGAAKEGTFNKYKERGLREIVRFDNVTKPWVARSGLPPELTASLRRGLIAVRDPAVLQSLGKKLTGFAEVRDEEYEFVRIGMEKSKEFLGASVEESGARTARSRPAATGE